MKAIAEERTAVRDSDLPYVMGIVTIPLWHQKKQEEKYRSNETYTDDTLRKRTNVPQREQHKLVQTS